MDQDFTPKYHHIKKSLRDLIESGAYSVDQQIPSDRELCQQFGVSRITATRAIGDLVKEGLLYRIQGKGTFVARPKIQEGVLGLTGFTERMRRLGIQVETRTVDCSLGVAPDRVLEELNLPPGSQVVHLRRLRLVEGQPLCLADTYHPYPLCSFLLTADLDNCSLYDLLEHKNKMSLGEGEQSIGLSFADVEDSRLLGIPLVQPVLDVQLRALLRDGTPIELGRTLYRADRYRYVVKLNRSALNSAQESIDD